MERGTQYTLSFSPSLWTYVSAGAFDVARMDSALQAVSGISQASAWSPAKFSGQVNVTFTYVGDGADAVGNMAGNIIDAFSSFGTFDYIGASAGASAPGVEKPSLPGLPSLPGASSLWAIAVIAALGLFVFSGGAAAARRVLA